MKMEPIFDTCAGIMQTKQHVQACCPPLMFACFKYDLNYLGSNFIEFYSFK